MVDEGYLTESDADEVSQLIDLVTELVRLGGMTPEHAELAINKLAREKADDWLERHGILAEPAVSSVA